MIHNIEMGCLKSAKHHLIFSKHLQNTAKQIQNTITSKHPISKTKHKYLPIRHIFKNIIQSSVPSKTSSLLSLIFPVKTMQNSVKLCKTSMKTLAN